MFVRTDVIQSQMVHFGHSDYTQVATQGLRPFGSLRFTKYAMLCLSSVGFVVNRCCYCHRWLVACLFVVVLGRGCVVVFVFG